MVFFASPSRSGLLQVDDAFVTLQRIAPNGDLTFELIFDVKYLDALRLGASIVKSTLSDEYITNISNVATTTIIGYTDTGAYITGLTRGITRAKALARARQLAIVATVKTDLTAYIDNRNANAAETPTKYVVKTVSVDELKQRGEVKPVLTQLAHSSLLDYPTAVSSSIALDRRKTMLEMVNAGTDPSILTDLTHKSSTTFDAVGGMLRQKRVEVLDNSPAAQLLNSVILNVEKTQVQATTNDIISGQSIQVLETQNADTVTVYANVFIPAKRLIAANSRKDVDVLFVDIELIDPSTGLALETVSKKIDISKYVRFKNTPFRAPKVNVLAVNSHDISIELMSGDDVTQTFDVYRRNPEEISKYEHVASFVGSQTDKTTLQIKRPLSITEIYRVVPVGVGGIKGSEFTNVIIKPNAKISQRTSSVIPLSIDNGVQLQVLNIPYDSSAIIVTSRDLTQNAASELNVGSPVVIDAETRQQKTVFIVDPNVIDKHTYEYVAYACSENGIKKRICTSTFKYEKLQMGRVDTRITNVTVDVNDDVDVTFDLASTINDTTIDLVKDVLTRNDVVRYFDNDIQKQREFLKQLLVHGVQRINLFTGQRDDFGQITALSFSDKALREKRAIEAPVPGLRYRYEIYVMLRSPETVLEGILKDAVDPVTKKPYVYSPSKYLHPVTLEGGLLTSKVGLNLRFGLDEMTFGSIGMTSHIDVTINETNFTLTNASVEKFDAETLIINWSTDGDLDTIDHFLIVKETNDVRTVVGKAHSFFGGACNFIAKLTPRDTGELRYFILPITIGYETLPFLYTNTIVVGT